MALIFFSVGVLALLTAVSWLLREGTFFLLIVGAWMDGWISIDESRSLHSQLE